jgi:MFS family permease
MQLWYPRHERGFVQGVTHSASRLGAAIAPPIVVFIMTTYGWHAVFYICGAAGIVWSILWFLTYRDFPEQHPIVNEAELQHIRGLDAAGNVNQAQTEKPSVPWATLLRSPNMWAIMCAYFGALVLASKLHGDGRDFRERRERRGLDWRPTMPAHPRTPGSEPSIWWTSLAISPLHSMGSE